ncbi:DUF4097 family beta strand repeat-containing protein [Pseudonocardia sp. MH-G8]|uniref:DUF4097 family beta strand repeat-containing protein n=1 Tax=Pseudonocardia sp. MH-G8 TaxID=1854588 RepID=UPI000BA15D2D|nr:DUF4097 family beta strand repeat-containing protein [Pseudonocardia sp. MH-G8]OZM84175.1 hypothetical protein CFP66_07190 [Pseudonocardia sp. MH-G8]
MRALGVLGIAVVLGAGGIVAARAALPGPATEETLAFDLQAPRLAVEVGSGAVTLHRADGDRVEVRRTVRSRGVEPRLEEESSAEGVRLAAECPWAFGASCTVDYDVRVPDDVALEVRTSSGDVTLGGLAAAAVDVRVSSGAVHLADLRGPIVVEASSGDVVGERLDTPSFSATASSGEVRADFASTPGEVAIVASSGDVEVALPAGSYRVEAATDSGDERVAVPVDAAAAAVVRVEVGSGDVEVRPR